MDLRPYIKTKTQLYRGVDLIRQNLLFYQPFILSDHIEVGEAQNLCDNYKDSTSVFDNNVYAKDINFGDRKLATDLARFRKLNDEYRSMYNYICDTICKQFNGDIKELTFGEIGCNTGLNLFNLAVRGAKECNGYDWNNMSGVFCWLNDILQTNVKFTVGTYDNLQHRFKEVDIPEVDVMINTVFTNHQCDILQFLCYICDRARKGVFLMVLTNLDTDGLTILYDIPPDSIIPFDRPFPLFFSNGVTISEKLLRLSMQQLGFEDVMEIEKFNPGKEGHNFMHAFRMFFAKRTKNIKSAYWNRDHSAEK